MNFLIAGCGYVGTAMGRDLARNHHQVWGLRRSHFETAGIQPIIANLLDLSSLKNLPAVDGVIFCQAISHDSDSYQKTYYEGTQNLLQLIQAKKVIFISSTSVYGNSDGAWVDEKTFPRPSDPNAKILLETEKLVLCSRIPSMVLRLAGIYGPNRNRIQTIRSGNFKPALDEKIYTNRIHIDDIVQAIKLLIEKGKPGEIYLGVDNDPCTQKEFYGWIYEQLKITPPKNSTDDFHPHRSNKRCSGAKLKALGLKLKYPSFREGYESLNISSP